MLRRAMALVLAFAAAAMWAPPRPSCAAATARGAHVTRQVGGRERDRLKKAPVGIGTGPSFHSSRSTPSSSSFRRDATGARMAAAAAAAEDLRSEYLQVLLSRRRDLQGQPHPPPSPPLELINVRLALNLSRRTSASVRGAREPGEGAAVPRERASGVQGGQDPPLHPTHSSIRFGIANCMSAKVFQVMESCPRKEVENFEEKLVEENFYLITEVVLPCHAFV